jgi:hypothetical protein
MANESDVEALLRRPTLFIEELAAVLRCSRDTIERRLRNRTFPIKPLPHIDVRRRWSTTDVRGFLRLPPTPPGRR